ncbi:hypothetical protein ACHAXT_002872 [Thalassiosira profunda]
MQSVDESAAPRPRYNPQKPKWWTRLSGRRGTRAQRAAIRRMTERGYCLDKDVLREYSRVNNDRRRCGIECRSGEDWRRVWWDRYLGIATDDSFDPCDPAMEQLGAMREKYTHQIQEMYRHRNPLPPKKYQQIWLEIGFGNGDNLLANARNRPDILFVGSEIHQPGVGAVLRRMEEEMGLGGNDGEKIPGAPGNGNEESTAAQFFGDASTTEQTRQSARAQQQLKNVRILPGDGIKLISHLPWDYVDAILVTFPDPWPKESHAQWRVIQCEVVREMHRVLKSGSGSGRVYVATDAECFDNWTKEVFRQESSSWEEVRPCPEREGWLPVVSYYEQKGLDEGRRTMLQCWQCL